MVKLIEELKKVADPQKAKLLQGFFKTAPGQYGYGDVFWGITIPQNRRIAQSFIDISYKEISLMMRHEVHEVRMCSLMILVEKFKQEPQAVYKLYMANKKYVNNWDLVDLTAYKIVGAYLKDRPKAVLYKLAQSKELWDRRIAIVSTFYFIQSGFAEETFKISDMLMGDKEDLMHKAVGWMLREVGKRCSEKELKSYLKDRYQTMPRTMLRYAIERFPADVRKKYLLGKV